MNTITSAIFAAVTLILLFSFTPQSFAHETPIFSHSGGTDKCGCHTNRKTGEYHCHTRKQRGGSCPASFQDVPEIDKENSDLKTSKLKNV